MHTKLMYTSQNVQFMYIWLKMSSIKSSLHRSFQACTDPSLLVSSHVDQRERLRSSSPTRDSASSPQTMAAKMRETVFNSFVLDALATSIAAKLYRPHSSNTDMKSCHNSNASSSPAPFVAAGRDPRHIDSDTLSPNSLLDRPKASKFKRRGRRAGKAPDATADCSSGCKSIIE